MRRKTNEEFLDEMQVKHPTLSALEPYKNGRTKIKIRCNVCGHEYMVTPGSLYMGYGCPKCAGLVKTHDEYVAEMKILHPSIEVLGTYAGSKVKVGLRCKTCGHEWSSIPNASLRGRGCPQCAGTMRKTHGQFLEEMETIHPDIEVIGEYYNNRERVECRCKTCGNIFMGHPKMMLYHGYGCPHCSMSRGEKYVRDWLNEKDIPYMTQYTFKDCRDIHVLPFDFYIPSKNVAIEFDGKQHYEVNEFFGGEEAFDTLRLHDEIKNKYCTDNGIRLLRIPYWEIDNIRSILDFELAN